MPATLTASSQAWLDRFTGNDLLADAYLAGSAGLALQLGHREVRDLDFMSATDTLRSPRRRDLLGGLRRIDPTVRVETARDGFLYVRDQAGVALRFYYYPYPLLARATDLDPATASLLDLGLMKLAAIIGRGGRRDFVDLFLICEHRSLDGLFAHAAEKFGHVRDFSLQALKALGDHAIAEEEPMPRMHQDVSWSAITDWTVHEVERLGRDLLGLGPHAEPSADIVRAAESG